MKPYLYFDQEIHPIIRLRFCAYILLILSIYTLPTHLAAATGSKNHISIVGSSTAYPIVSTVVEHFARNSSWPAPVVISMGTGGGFKLFCSDHGTETPDITMASRKIKQSEINNCAANDFKEILEIKIGYDGIAFASSKESQQFNFRETDLYLALAKEVPHPKGYPELVPNPYTKWNEINPSLPRVPIRVYGPPPTSGTRDILIERLIENACTKHDFLRQLAIEDNAEYRRRCYTFREDGAYINSGESDIRIVRKLADEAGTIGILGYNYLDQNSDILQAATIDGISPEFEIIEINSYPLSRPLYLYVKKTRAQSITAIQEFLLEFTSDASWGTEGYLADKGLIPLSLKEQKAWRCELNKLKAALVNECH